MCRASSRGLESRLQGMLGQADKLRTAKGRGAESRLERGILNTPEEAEAFPKGSMYNEAYSLPCSPAPRSYRPSTESHCTRSSPSPICAP
ncbi:hypothetical protein ACF061_31265 [Streptomyces sp. NPDC015220]|uniref:hypothetical protein n=1 Tax=Streptomyces sp. NPDC015220 TaxID=3364947 RepID=UPI0037019223